MRLLFLLIPLLLVFNGCGPAPKRYSKPKAQPVFSGKNLGHGIFYYSGEDLVSRVIAKNHKYLSDPYDVKKMLQDLNFVRKVKGKYTLSTLNDIKYELDTDSKKVKYASFKYSPTKKMYALSGRYMFINRFYSKGKTDVYKWPVRFVAMFDETTKQLQGIYYNANSSYDKQNAYVSENVKAAYFTSYHGGFILNFETLKATSIPNTKLYTFDHEKSKYSKSGRYFATNLFDSHKDGKTERGFLLFDSVTGKMLKKEKYMYRKSINASATLDYGFSDDEKYFIYKHKDSNFKVFDLEKKQEVASFGKSFSNYKSNLSQVRVVGKYIFASINAYEKGKDTTNKTYVYDTNKKEVFCEVENTLDGQPTLFVYKNGLNVVQSWEEHDVYNFEKDNCFKVKSHKIKSLYTDYKKQIFTYMHNDTIHFFEKGAITTRYTPTKYSVSQETKSSMQKIEKIKKFYKAGFERKALDKLKVLMKEDTYDFFSKQYTALTNFLSSEDKGYVNLIAFKNYIEKGVRNKEFERAARNYFFLASRYGFKELLLPFIEEYKKAIGENATKYQKDMLAVYMATYLLDIGKDAEAYEILFDHAPFHKDVLWVVTRYSSWNMGITKNKKKLAVAMDIKENKLSKVEKKIKKKFFYDVNENRVKYGDSPKKVMQKKAEKIEVPKVKESTPKQDAIKLLD